MGLDLALGLPPGLLSGGNMLFSSSSIAITPTLSAELLVNGDFSAWTGDDPDNWTVGGESAADPQVCEVATGQGHASCGTPGGGMCNLYSSATAGAPSLSQTILTIDAWFRTTVTLDTVTSGSVTIRFPADEDKAISATTTITGRARSAAFVLRGGTLPCDVTVASASCKQITTTSQIFTEPSQYFGDFTINFNRTANYQAGVFGSYVDANNYLLCYVDGVGKARLIKNIAGTITALGAWAITYADDKDLTLRVHLNGTIDVIYNGSTLVSGLADTGLRGTDGGAFLTDASAVTINSFTWDARNVT